ncbi:uncharacterized protein LOC143531060 [Bidens hawaiensis]|uniref:uncharacterized protein LOC143531060 n=1 Tax=Bidens hawaiensis TaxID=980011 RepID=UPI00404994BF
MYKIIHISECRPEQAFGYATQSFGEEEMYWWESVEQRKSGEEIKAMKWKDLKELVMKRFCAEAEVERVEMKFFGLKTGTWTFRIFVFDSRGIERVNFNDELVYTGPTNHPELGYVPMVIEIESNDESEQHNQLIGVDVDIEDVDEPVLDIIVLHVQENNILEVVIRDKLRLPVEFARNNNLNVETDLVLINPNGVDISTETAIELNGINERYRVRHWLSFVRSNGLQFGTMVVFVYNVATHSLILTDVMSASKKKRKNDGSSSSQNQLNNSAQSQRLPFSNNTNYMDYQATTIVTLPYQAKYVDHENQSVMCPSCNALLWKAEVNRPSSSNEEGAFPLCCYNGKVELPDVRQPDESYLELFRGESAMSKYFLKNIRRFNSMFSFASMEGKIDHSINRGNVPYTFRLTGENYHCLGSLLPLDGRKPQFSQLYIYDTENEISNRQGVFCDNSSMVDEQEKHIINYLKAMLDSNNHLVQAYRMVRDCFEENPQLDLKLRIIGTRQNDARQYNLPSSSEVATLIVGDIGDAVDNRDIIVTKKSGSLKRISELHPSYTPLQYPLFHPFGEDGYQVNILHKNVSSSSTGARKKVTMLEFFAYRIQDRPNTFSTMLNGRRLFQKILVDKYTMIEAQRLHFMRGKQHELRCDTYQSLRGMQSVGNTDVSTAGQRVILPSSFTGGARYMMQNYLDAMCLCRCCLHDRVSKKGATARPYLHIYASRYVSECEATWRIFSFDVHYRLPSAMRLVFHLPGEQQVIYGANEDIEDILNKTTNASSMFTGWFECNKNYDLVKTLTYSKFPTKFVWKKQGRKWEPRLRGFAIGRVHDVPPAFDEAYYLRILLNKVKGPECFEDIRTVDGVVCETFRDACYKRGLLDDDKEYIEAIEETSHTSTGYYLRNLFAKMLITYNLSKPHFVWESTWQLLVDGILYKQQKDQNNPGLILNEEQLKNLALLEIENFLICNNSSFRRYQQMSFPDMETISIATNPLMVEELSYDTETMNNEFNYMFDSLTDERVVYNEIMSALIDKKGGAYFVYGYGGGTRKTYLWKTLSASIRSKGEVVLNVASSGIASLLLEGGRTAHSRFLIPINLTEDFICPVKGNTDVYELLKKTSLIIWDEAPMIHKHAFKALDGTLSDVMNGD